MTISLSKQTENAFEFISKLFFEVSYLIKEVEGILQREEEHFLICRPSGYAVTTRTSSGLDSMNVEMWLPKNFIVAFSPEEMTRPVKGQTATQFTPELKLLLLSIELAGKNISNPRIIAGSVSNIVSKKIKTYDKFEKLMWIFSYNREKVFPKTLLTSYEDSYCSFSLDLFEQPLFEINKTEDVKSKIVDPMLTDFRS